ncbi:MAG: sugar ABC transporter permease [Roseiarcus sp.]|jgi:multiple sugar transport system permease protein
MTSASISIPATRPRRRGDTGRRFGWWMIAPCLAMLAANSIFPLIYAVTVAFQSYQVLIPVPHRFIGLRNFEKIFSDDLFWSSLGVTAWFIAGVVLLQFPVGFGLAVLLQRLRRHQDLLVTLLLVPTIISTSVAGFQWVQLFNYQFGPINYLLGLLHLPQPTWTADPTLALPCLVFVDFWQWTPFMTLLLFAGLRSLPSTVVDAARIDGSTGWQLVWRIYLPLLRPVIGIAIILRVLMAFKLFDVIYVLTAGGPGIATENLAFYTYVQGFRYFDMGYAAALSILQLIAVAVLAKLLIRLTRRASAAMAKE